MGLSVALISSLNPIPVAQTNPAKPNPGLGFPLLLGSIDIILGGWGCMNMLPEDGITWVCYQSRDLWDPTSNSPKIGDLVVSEYQPWEGSACLHGSSRRFRSCRSCSSLSCSRRALWLRGRELPLPWDEETWEADQQTPR